MTKEELKEVLRLHALWGENSDQGKRADLCCADLRDADLRGVHLRGADLRCANLRDADLRYADLRGADLWRATLCGADLRGANLSGADLREADLCGADLPRADLRYASLSSVDLRGANLSGVDLRGADLQGADLLGTNLRGVIGNMEEVKSLQLEGHPITYTAESLQIGCKRHSINYWWDFSDETIAEMDAGALEWWRKWKEPLRQIIELSPAKTTGENK